VNDKSVLIIKWFLSLSVVTSIILIIWGATEQNQITSGINYYLIIATFGSALLGSTLSLSLEKLLNSSTNKSTLDLINNKLNQLAKLSSNQQRLTSNIKNVEHISGVWHQYNVTKKNDLYYWVYALYNINYSSNGEITFKVAYDNNDSGKSNYLYEGFVRDERVTLIGKPEKGNQPCFVEVWPNLTNAATTIHAGICFNQSWDSHDTIIPCIISRKPLMASFNLDDYKLDMIWQDKMKNNRTDVLPRVSAHLNSINGERKDEKS